MYAGETCAGGLVDVDFLDGGTCRVGSGATDGVVKDKNSVWGTRDGV